MADKKENAMGDGIPARLRGLDTMVTAYHRH